VTKISQGEPRSGGVYAPATAAATSANPPSNQSTHRVTSDTNDLDPPVSHLPALPPTDSTMRSA